MKRIATSILAAASLWFCGASLSAQSLSIHFNDGTVQEIDCAKVDSIVMTPAEELGPEFTIDMAEVKASRAHIIVNCDDPEARYYFDVCTLDAFERNNRDAKKIVDNIIADMVEDYPQLTLEQILTGLLESGQTEDVIKRLPSATDMVCYVVAVDDEGLSYGRPAIAYFTTLPAGNPADCTFAITPTDVTSEGCTVNIVPSDESIMYWYGICAVADYPGDVAMALAVKQAFAQAAQENGLSVSDLVSRICYTDEISEPESGLQTDTDYYIYAYALKDDGSNASPVSKVRFKTAAYDVSGADISLSYRYFDGDALYASDPETYANYQGQVLIQYQVTPNDLAAHWAVALGVGDMTDPDIYPDESTKNAVLQAGQLDAETKNLRGRWGEATFLYFAADAAGIDGPLKRMKVNFTKEGARPVSELTTSPLNVRMAQQAVTDVVRKPARIDGRLGATVGKGSSYRK